MQSRINELLNQIHQLEDQLEDVLKNHEVEFFYRLDGTRVRFEESVRRAHQKLRIGIFRWLGQSELRNVLSAPFIYGMIVPFAVLDASLWLYQQVCFRLYRVPRVRRSRYIFLDRHQLAYLNGIEKFNCIYCGYGNGLMGYAREIVARTEQYWCPVKHARRILDPHRRYARFAEFGDSEAYQAHLKAMRDELTHLDDGEPDSDTPTT